jgi:hypothetical protein
VAIGSGADAANGGIAIGHGVTSGTTGQIVIGSGDGQVVFPGPVVFNQGGENLVMAWRRVDASNGLTGGGDLYGDRNIQPVYGTTAGTVAQGNDPRFAASDGLGASCRVSVTPSWIDMATSFVVPWDSAQVNDDTMWSAADPTKIFPKRIGRYLVGVNATINGSASRKVTLREGAATLAQGSSPAGLNTDITITITIPVVVTALGNYWDVSIANGTSANAIIGIQQSSFWATYQGPGGVPGPVSDFKEPAARATARRKGKKS